MMHICSKIKCRCLCEYCPICHNGCPQCGVGRSESITTTTDVWDKEKISMKEKTFADKYIAEWEKQGRTPEEIFAVKNFMTGQGAKMLTDLAQSINSILQEIIGKLSLEIGNREEWGENIELAFDDGISTAQDIIREYIK